MRMTRLEAVHSLSELIVPLLRQLLFVAIILSAANANLFGHENTMESKLNRMGLRAVEQSRLLDGMVYAVAFLYFATSVVAAGVCGLWAAETGRSVASWSAFGFFFHIIAVPLVVILHAKAKRVTATSSTE